MSFVWWIVGGAAGFLLGSIPTGLWIGRAVRGIDIRRYGSGNLGATNVYRTLGPRWGILVLLLDAAKGWIAVWLAQTVVVAALGGGLTEAPGGGPAAAAAAGASSVQAVWAGLLGMAAAAIGHMFSPFASFRGGKGVATAAGAWARLAPLALAIALAVWIVLFALTRIVSVASIAAALVFPICVALFARSGSWLPILVFAGLTGVLLIVRHRSNIVRLLRGEERPLRLTRPSESRRP
jgi:glycerol-3-phosphate acyltransferase PlsY